MKKFIFTTLFLGAYVYCERANLNKIDMDPRIMNWSYVGPIKSVEVHDEMLQQILLNGIGNDSVFVFAYDKTYLMQNDSHSFILTNENH